MRNLAFTHCKRIRILQFFYGLLIMYTVSSWTNSYQMSQVHSWRYVETLVIKSYIFPERKKQPPKEYPSNDLKLICERSFPVFPISERNRKWLVFPISIISFICPEKKNLKKQRKIYLPVPNSSIWSCRPLMADITASKKHHGYTEVTPQEIFS